MTVCPKSPPIGNRIGTSLHGTTLHNVIHVAIRVGKWKLPDTAEETSLRWNRPWKIDRSRTRVNAALGFVTFELGNLRKERQ